MARPLSGLNAAEVAAAYQRPALFVELECKSGYIRTWSGVGPLTALARTFNGVGLLGSISRIPESGELSPLRVSLSISGVPQNIVALSLDRTEYRLRPVRIWLGFLNADFDDVVDTPRLRWAGTMSTMQGRMNGAESRITVNCESDLIRLRIPNVVLLNHEAQQTRFPGDRGLEAISTVAQAPIYWGGPGPKQGGGYGNK